MEEFLDQEPDERIRPLRRREYDHLVEMGVFEDERVELLYGRIVEMSPQGALHGAVIRRLTMILAHALMGRAEVQVQGPFAASDTSEPEPDLAVVPLERFTGDHPTRALLVIEVAQSSLKKDRDTKARLYAESAIPEYWIVDLKRRRILVHTAPTGGKYESIVSHGGDATLRPLAFPDLAVPFAQVLPS